jgi:hypothetical protein
MSTYVVKSERIRMDIGEQDSGYMISVKTDAKNSKR